MAWNSIEMSKNRKAAAATALLEAEKEKSVRFWLGCLEYLMLLMVYWKMVFPKIFVNALNIKRTRRRFTAEFKAQVALAAITERYSLLAELATRCHLLLR